MNQNKVFITAVGAVLLVAALVLVIIMLDRGATNKQANPVEVSPSAQQPSERPSEVGGVYDDKGRFLEDDAGVPKVEETDDVTDEERRDAALESEPDGEEEKDTREIAISWAKAFFDTDVSEQEWRENCKKNAAPELSDKLAGIDYVKIPAGPPKYAKDNVLIRSSDLGRYTYQIDGAHKGDSKTSLLVEIQMNKGKWQVQTFDWTDTNF